MKYAVTVIYTAAPTIEVEADDIYQAQYAAFKKLGAVEIETTTDRDGNQTTHGRTAETVEVAGQKVQLLLTSWHAQAIRGGAS